MASSWFHLSRPLTLQLETSHLSTKTSSALLTPSDEAITNLSPLFQLETSPSTWEVETLGYMSPSLLLACVLVKDNTNEENRYYLEFFEMCKFHLKPLCSFLNVIFINFFFFFTSILRGPLPCLTVAASWVQDLWFVNYIFINEFMYRVWSTFQAFTRKKKSSE